MIASHHLAASSPHPTCHHHQPMRVRDGEILTNQRPVPTLVLSRSLVSPDWHCSGSHHSRKVLIKHPGQESRSETWHNPAPASIPEPRANFREYKLMLFILNADYNQVLDLVWLLYATESLCNIIKHRRKRHAANWFPLNMFLNILSVLLWTPLNLSIKVTKLTFKYPIKIF